MNLFDQLQESALDDLSLEVVLLNTALAIILSQILSWHYVRFAQVLSNKRKFARLFVFIATTTLLMISVVKTSLALSLGLVGALSIIRFRTPIKEPEELAYLFLAIAVGIGLGADQRLITLFIFAVVLIYLAVRHWSTREHRTLRSVLHVSVELSGADGTASSGEAELNALIPAIQSICRGADLRRVDRHHNEFNASVLIETGDAAEVAALLRRVQETLPGSNVSVVERDGLE